MFRRLWRRGDDRRSKAVGKGHVGHLDLIETGKRGISQWSTEGSWIVSHLGYESFARRRRLWGFEIRLELYIQQCVRSTDRLLKERGRYRFEYLRLKSLRYRDLRSSLTCPGIFNVVRLYIKKSLYEGIKAIMCADDHDPRPVFDCPRQCPGPIDRRTRQWTTILQLYWKYREISGSIISFKKADAFRGTDGLQKVDFLPWAIPADL